SFCTCSVGRDYHTISPLRMCCNRRPRKQGDAVMLKNRMLKIWSIILTGSLVAVGVSMLICLPTDTKADSGVIQLQQIPNQVSPETEGDDFVPAGVDSNLVLSSGVNTNGFGRVVLTKSGAVQDFLVEANNLPPGPNAFNFAFG